MTCSATPGAGIVRAGQLDPAKHVARPPCRGGPLVLASDGPARTMRVRDAGCRGHRPGTPIAHMSKEYRWISAEVERWIADGVVTAEQGARIRGRYQPADTGEAALSWGLIVFFALGAVVIGLGVILLLAYNWSGIPKAGKLAIVFGSIVAAHGSGLALHRKADWRAMLGEGTLALGTMLFGAGIWLVAQIYNIDEHFPTGFLVWGVGALALSWAMPSVPQAIIATVVLTFWRVVEVVEFGNAVDGALVLLVVALGGLIWRLRSALLAAFVLAGLYIQILAHVAHWGGQGAALSGATAISIALVAAAQLIQGGRLPSRVGRVFRFYGVTGFLVCAYICSFAEGSRSLLRLGSDADGAVAAAITYRWTLFAAAATAWGVLAARHARRGDGWPPLEQWFYPLALVCVIGASMMDLHRDAALLAGAFNLIIAAVSGLWIVRGCREGRLKDIVLGSVVLGLLVFARYFDLFDSLAARGLVFVLFGGALFAEGFFYRKVRTAAQSEPGGAR